MSHLEQAVSKAIPEGNGGLFVAIQQLLNPIAIFVDSHLARLVVFEPRQSSKCVTVPPEPLPWEMPRRLNAATPEEISKNPQGVSGHIAKRQFMT